MTHPNRLSENLYIKGFEAKIQKDIFVDSLKRKQGIEILYDNETKVITEEQARTFISKDKDSGYYVKTGSGFAKTLTAKLAVFSVVKEKFCLVWRTNN